jgi:prophage regulatory protein
LFLSFERNDVDPIQDRILKQPEVLQISSMSISALRLAIKRGDFPAPVKLAQKRAIGWRASDIQSWLQNLQPVGSKGAVE